MPNELIRGQHCQGPWPRASVPGGATAVATLHRWRLRGGGRQGSIEGSRPGAPPEQAPEPSVSEGRLGGQDTGGWLKSGATRMPRR
jgi:hypothetical protein